MNVKPSDLQADAAMEPAENQQAGEGLTADASAVAQQSPPEHGLSGMEPAFGMANAVEADRLVVRLNTTIRIRWLAVIGQTAAVLFVSQVLGYDMLLLPCLLVIAMSAWLNIFLRFRYSPVERWRGRALMGVLGYDTLQLASLLYLTGGIQNPFSILIIVPVVVSATTQRVKYMLPLLALSLACATVLVFQYQPLPWAEPGGIDLPLVLKGGIWVALACAMVFTALYALRVADESRKLADALSATELVLQREQHVSNLDGLAAAAAHELGTPLATIQLVVKEMLRETKPDTPQYDDLKLLQSQADRCREILRKISTLSSQGDENISLLPIRVLLEEVAEPHRIPDIKIEISADGVGPAPVTFRNPSILYGLGNLVENASDFAASRVGFSAAWDEETVTITIEDDGPGFPPGLPERIGEPYLSNRDKAHSETGGGLGLGLFIAKTLLERNNAQLAFENKRNGGAIVFVSWSRAVFDQPSEGPTADPNALMGNTVSTVG